MSLFLSFSCSTKPDTGISIADLKQEIRREDSILQSNKIKPTSALDSNGKPFTKRVEKKIENCEEREDFDVPSEIESLINIEFSDYRIARNSDFPNGYWCNFYSEN